MMLNLGYNQLGGRLDGLNLGVTTQAYLVTSRQAHIDEALKDGYTHLLFLDDDMTFPPDVVEQLLKHNKPIVTANYRKKSTERVEFVCSDMDNKQVDSRNKTGVERIFAGGMGVTLIDLSYIKHIPRPHFSVVWHKDIQRFIIEDSYFANVMNVYGVEIWCDHDLSKQVGHVGECEFRITPQQSTITMGAKGLNSDFIVKEGVVGYEASQNEGIN